MWRERGLIRFAGFVGVISPVASLLAVLAATFLCGLGCGVDAPAWIRWGDGGEFSWRVNALSDLGVSRVADLFNYSLISAGLLNAVFTLGFMKAYAKNTSFRLGCVLLMLGGGSLSLVGVFTEEYGVMHWYASLGYFIVSPVAMIILGVSFAKTNMKKEGYASIFAGAVALSIIVSGLALEYFRLSCWGFAVPEFAEAAVIVAWFLYMASGMLRLYREGD